MLEDRGGKDNYKRVYSISAFFYLVLTQHVYTEVKEWTKEVILL